MIVAGGRCDWLYMHHQTQVSALRYAKYFRSTPRHTIHVDLLIDLCLSATVGHKGFLNRNTHECHAA